MQGTEGHFEVDGWKLPVTEWIMIEDPTMGAVSPLRFSGHATVGGFAEAMVGAYEPKSVKPSSLTRHDSVWATLTSYEDKRYTFPAIVTLVLGSEVVFQSIGSVAESA